MMVGGLTNRCSRAVPPLRGVSARRTHALCGVVQKSYMSILHVLQMKYIWNF